MNIKSADMQVFEILENYEATQGRTNKLNLLKSYKDHQPLKYVLKFNFCDTIKSLIPEGRPPFNEEHDDGPSRASLWQYMNVFPTFVVSPRSENIKPLQREKIFIEMLEAIAVEEANMIILAKDKTLVSLYPSLDISIVVEAFPDMMITTNKPIVEPTKEEKAIDIMEVIKEKKSIVTTLQSEIKVLTKEAKSLSE
jgi:hypothetical protein